MQIGKSRILFPLIIFLIGLFAKDKVWAQNHTEFLAIPLPSPHLLESKVQFGQDAQGQIWLVTEQGLSIFRDGQFISFRQFNFNEGIVSATFVGNQLVVATSKNVYKLALSSPTSEIIPIWRTPAVGIISNGENALLLSTAAPRERFAKYVKSRGVNKSVYLLTNMGLYELSVDDTKRLGQSYVPESNLIKSIDASATVQLVTLADGLVLMTDRELAYFSNEERNWQSVRLDIDARAVAVLDRMIYLVDQDGHLLQGDPFGWEQTRSFSQLKAFDEVTGFVQGFDSLYVRQGHYLRSVHKPDNWLKEANRAHNIFLDNNNNFWLSTPFDIQVAWWQPIAAHPMPEPASATFFTGQMLEQTGTYAISNNTLFHSKSGRSSPKWQPVYRFTLDSGSIQKLISTDHHLWAVSETGLTALDKSSLTISHHMPLAKGSLVLPYNRQRVMVFRKEQVVSVSGLGRTTIEKDSQRCQSSCLPDYRISDFMQGKSLVWLATDKGLHSLSLDDLSFSEHRLDGLNQLSPLLTVKPASEQKLWLVYPDRVAAYKVTTGTSDLFYSQLNRILDGRVLQLGKLLVNSQRGWLSLELPAQRNGRREQVFVVQQVTRDLEHQYLTQVEENLVLADNQDELHLAFNIGKQHPAQTLLVRFKYKEDARWTVVSALNHALTLKNLRQGANQIQLQARLEGQNWQHAKTITYILPYRFFQTKWVMVFVAVFLLALLAVVAYERLNRVQVMFNSIKQQAFISSLLDSTHEGVWVANKDREIQSVNQAFVDITGFGLRDVEGKSFQLLTSYGRNHEVESLIWQEVIKSGFWSGEVWSKKANGEKVSLDLSVTRVETENKLMGKTDVKFVGVFSDVTERKNSERDLRQLATRDPLTGLVNRTLFIEQVNHSIETISPSNPHFAVMFIDLDNFKKVNESLGPLKGDEFIKQVAQRLSSCLPKGVSIARLGGDEFALLISNHLFSGVPAFYIKRVATDIQRELQPAFYLDGTEITITASIGVSIFPTHGDKPELLMRCADTALNRVKISGRNNCLIYDHVMDDLVNDKLSLESELIAALQKDEFLVYYQPKYKMQENQICGFEALVRWQNPNRGLVPPDQFVSIAEDNGLIRQLDFWVLRQVCRQIKAWLKTDTLKGKVAVNISALNFQQAEFCQSVISLVVEEGDLIPYIELEITETAMMRDPDRALESIKTLRSKGFSIALDDFGTGHSSLGYLKRFPIDRIKIDRTFVKDIEYAAQDRNITSVIVQLAKHLGIEVIAEGVESEMQAYILHVMGCNEIQGYLVSRPILAEQVGHFVTVDARKLQQIAEARDTLS